MVANQANWHLESGCHLDTSTSHLLKAARKESAVLFIFKILVFIQACYDGYINIRIHVTNCLLSKVAKRIEVAMTWVVLGDGYCHEVDNPR